MYVRPATMCGTDRSERAILRERFQQEKQRLLIVVSVAGTKAEFVIHLVAEPHARTEAGPGKNLIVVEAPAPGQIQSRRQVAGGLKVGTTLVGHALLQQRERVDVPNRRKRIVHAIDRRRIVVVAEGLETAADLHLAETP
jgi:hypothetical protein